MTSHKVSSIENSKNQRDFKENTLKIENKMGKLHTKTNINFNIKLAALPRKLIEYIVIHELAHTKESRHNKRFWYIVETFCRDYRERRQEVTSCSLLIQRNKIWKRIQNSSP